MFEYYQTLPQKVCDQSHAMRLAAKLVRLVESAFSQRKKADGSAPLAYRPPEILQSSALGAYAEYVELALDVAEDEIGARYWKKAPPEQGSSLGGNAVPKGTGQFIAESR
jgi:hypothetical protein